jgi:hypothetical protein
MVVAHLVVLQSPDFSLQQASAFGLRNGSIANNLLHADFGSLHKPLFLP